MSNQVHVFVSMAAPTRRPTADHIARRTALASRPTATRARDARAA